MTRDEVITQLAAVRETGATNMLNKGGVRDVAEQCEFDELIEFIDENSSSEYMEVLQEMGDKRS